MKTSNKILISVLLAVLLFELILLAVFKYSLESEPYASDSAVLQAHQSRDLADSIQVVVPPPAVRWYNLTLGLKVEKSQIQHNCIHIFQDLGLCGCINKHQIDRIQFSNPYRIPLNFKREDYESGMYRNSPGNLLLTHFSYFFTVRQRKIGGLRPK